MTTNSRFLITAAAALLALVAQPALASASETGTSVLSAEGRADAERAPVRAPVLKSQESAPSKGTQSRLNRKTPTDRASASVNQSFWIYDAFTTLANDFDGDGFFTRVELTFDADTVFEVADVYAVLYLSLEGGPWVEYGQTAVFDIYGAGGDDSYFFDADLVSGFAPGYYDILIDLYDDFDGRLVASFGPAESADLFDLPLESEIDDAPVEPVVVVTSEGGGSAGLGLLSLLLLSLGLRRKPLQATDDL